MINFDSITRENIKQHNGSWPQIPDHSFKILITGGSGSGKTNGLLNLTSHQPYIDKKNLYAKDPYKAKCQLLINKHESLGLKYYNDFKALIE